MITLTKYNKNSKQHTDEQIKLLAKMIARFGWRQPILVNSKNVIIAGHGRYLAYLSMPDKIKTPWVIDDKGNTISGKAETKKLSEEEEKAYRHLDNLVMEMTNSDIAIYNEEITTIEDEELLSFFDNEENIKEHDDAEEIELAKLQEDKASFVFSFPQSEYSELLQAVQKAMSENDCETKEELFKFLLQLYRY